MKTRKEVTMRTKFEQLAKEIGFGPAVVVLQKKLPFYFFNGLSLEKWEEIYKAALPGSELRKVALEKLAESVRTPEELIRIYKNPEATSYIKEVAFTAFEERVGDWFSGWSRICEKIFLGGDSTRNAKTDEIGLRDLGGRAIEKIRELAKDSNDWGKWNTVYFYAPSGSETEREARLKIANLATDLDDLMVTWNNVCSDPELEKIVWKKIKKRIRNIDDLLHVYMERPRKNSTQEKILKQLLINQVEKLRNPGVLLKILRKVGDDPNGEMLSSTVLDKLLKMAKGLDQKIEIYKGVVRNCPLGWDLEERIRAEIKKSAKNFNDWRKVSREIFYQPGVVYSNEFRREVFAELKKEAKTFGEWREVWRTATTDEEEELALNKMSELASTFEELLEIFKKTRHLSKKIAEGALAGMQKFVS